MLTMIMFFIASCGLLIALIFLSFRISSAMDEVVQQDTEILDIPLFTLLMLCAWILVFLVSTTYCLGKIILGVI